MLQHFIWLHFSPMFQFFRTVCRGYQASVTRSNKKSFALSIFPISFMYNLDYVHASSVKSYKTVNSVMALSTAISWLLFLNSLSAQQMAGMSSSHAFQTTTFVLLCGQPWKAANRNVSGWTDVQIHGDICHIVFKHVLIRAFSYQVSGSN